MYNTVQMPVDFQRGKQSLSGWNSFLQVFDIFEEMGINLCKKAELGPVDRVQSFYKIIATQYKQMQIILIGEKNLYSLWGFGLD